MHRQALNEYIFSYRSDVSGEQLYEGVTQKIKEMKSTVNKHINEKGCEIPVRQVQKLSTIIIIRCPLVNLRIL